MKRRKFLLSCASTLGSGIALAGVQQPLWKTLERTKDAVEVRNTAKNLIFILLDGAPSHVDTFDLKVGSYTPTFLGARSIGGGNRWPAGLMPELDQRLDKFSIVRSISAIEAVHDRAVYHVLTSHRMNPATVSDVPHFGSVLSHMLAEQRNAAYNLPTVIRVGAFGPGAGFLDSAHYGLTVNQFGQVENLNHSFEGANDRLDLLNGLQGKMGRIRDERFKYLGFHDQAQSMMSDQELVDLFAGAENLEFEPDTLFRTQCEMAVNVLKAQKGTRVIQLRQEGWDHHSDIYDTDNFFNLYGLSRAFDKGMAYLLDELEATPAANGDGTLLDETLVVAMGEFGRTVGNLNSDRGRDHFPSVVPALFAGGGVKPGRVIGASNAIGEYITDTGWSHNRYMTINDVVATIYSAMGVGWHQRLISAQTGRTFDMVDSPQVGQVYEIDSLFT